MCVGLTFESLSCSLGTGGWRVVFQGAQPSPPRSCGRVPGFQLPWRGFSPACDLVLCWPPVSTSQGSPRPSHSREETAWGLLLPCLDRF